MFIHICIAVAGFKTAVAQLKETVTKVAPLCSHTCILGWMLVACIQTTLVVKLLLCYIQQNIPLPAAAVPQTGDLSVLLQQMRAGPWSLLQLQTTSQPATAEHHHRHMLAFTCHVTLWLQTVSNKQNCCTGLWIANKE